MFLLLLRKFWFRRPRSNAEKSSCPIATSIDSGISVLKPQEKEPQMPDITFATTAPQTETDIIVNQLAQLAATVSHTSSNNQHGALASAQTETQQFVSTTDLPTEPPEEEEETFYYLSSLITISCLPSHTPTRSTSTLASRGARRKSLVFDGKRASSILSLNIGDLPSLPFPRSKHKVTPKSGPRYSPLPPPFVQKSLAMRPEVRF
jgi:hypothetical protein